MGDGQSVGCRPSLPGWALACFPAMSKSPLSLGRLCPRGSGGGECAPSASPAPDLPAAGSLASFQVQGQHEQVAQSQRGRAW